MATLLCNLTVACSLIALGQPLCAVLVVVVGGLTVLVQAAIEDDEDEPND